MKTAILGGTFNPIHNGHLAIAKGAAEKLGLDRVILIPTFVPPHKELGDFLAPVEHRLKMCELAAAEEALLEVSDMELRRGGRSYTLETVCELLKNDTISKLYFICGADMFLSIKSWYGYEELIRKVIFCAAPRNNTDPEILTLAAEALRADGGRALLLDLSEMDLSSTKIRLLLKNHLSVKGLLPARVEEYIYVHGLYV
ncbi:MAG TPA: nicotinate (nicotinamide) nucleotide adenylyltransferase [Ruminococcaceae bacterium]|nr:nicotinate (nicotinamide) nucleotide adenylyltransferase [Oscillospiraceae bacterium]